ncbi:MAG: SIS domain-containing protein [Desulfurococcales archaeon]|nr:SIS domain-containing protein [Desulfurococcales archaeon]
MEETYKSWPSLIRSVTSLTIPTIDADRYDTLVITGVGGSGIVGDFIHNYTYELDSLLHIVSLKDLQVPKPLLGRKTLVVAVSYSGNTTETLNAVRKFLDSGSRVIGVTSGGLLKQVLGRDNTVEIPIGYQPRAAFPLLLGAVLKFLIDNNILEAESRMLETIAGKMEDLKMETLSYAARLGDEISLHNRGPIILACRKYYPLALRMRQELSENSKLVSIAEELPDAAHNLIVGYTLSREERSLVTIDPGERYCSALLSIYEDVTGYAPIRVELKGDNIVEKTIWGSWLAGLASVHASKKRGFNPEDIEPIKQYRLMLKSLINEKR